VGDLASRHAYDVNSCADESCRHSTLGPPVAAQVPLVAGEIGENTCSRRFAEQVMQWFDDRGLPYGPDLEHLGPLHRSVPDLGPRRDLTAYGIGLRDRPRALNG
jgi:hypothetical protein